MWSVLVLCLAAGDAVSEAGGIYRQALETLEAQKYEAAVELMKKALQRVGEESDHLKYRDGVSRQNHPYYPYYGWGRARLLQAGIENSVYARRDLLQDAIGRLGQTQHPSAPKLLEDAKVQLKKVEEAIALDSSFAAVKGRIELLGSNERFIEALKLLEETAQKFMTREKELEVVRTSLKEKQAAVVKRYEQFEVQRLGDVAVTDPLTAADSIIPLLKPAIVPAEVTEETGPPFLWAKNFIELWGKESETVRRSSELKGPAVIATSEKLDAIALEALGLGLDAGFRAARHLGHAGRMAKLRDIASGSEDVIDLETTAALVKSLNDGIRKSREALAKSSIKGEPKTRLESDLAAQEKAAGDLDKQIQAGSKERKRLTAPILLAETALADGDTLGDLAVLNKQKNDLFELESEATFGTLTARLRARALFAHAVAEAMVAFMEGNPQARVVDRCRVPAWRAYGFDSKVELPWAGRLSPKLQKVFDQIKPQ